jgi:hypothetical protein
LRGAIKPQAVSAQLIFTPKFAENAIFPSHSQRIVENKTNFEATQDP